MGQKVHPVGFRVGIIRDWESKWYADKDYQRFLHEDLRIRTYLKEKLHTAGISRITIERAASKAKVFVHAAKPGVIIGRRAENLDRLRADLNKMTSTEIFLNVIEVRKVETDSTLVAENIAQQLERRVSFRRAMKRAVQNSMRMGALGIRINVAGRLGGAEIARTEWYREGRVPLHTLRADIDYAIVEAKTAYGIIGIKVWIFKGEIMEHDPQARDRRQSELQEGGVRPSRERGDRDRERAR